MATHKAVNAARPSGFDFEATVKAIVENYNAMVPGRAPKKGAPPKEREKNATIIFNPEGRGAHAYRLLDDTMVQYGGNSGSIKLDEIRDTLVKLGYVPTIDTDDKGKRTLKVVPVKGVAAAAGVDTSSLLGKMGLLKPQPKK